MYTKNWGEPRFSRAAMRIGGENSFIGLEGAHLRKFAKRNSFEEDWVLQTFRNMATELPDALSDAFAKAAEVAETASLRAAMLDQIAAHCKKAERML